MQRAVLAVAAATLCLVAAIAAATAHSGRAQQTTVATQIRQTERTLLRATVAGDVAAMRGLLAPDFQLIDPFGSPESRTTYLGNVNGGVDFLTFKPVTSIAVRAYGRAAIARFQAAFVVVAGPDKLKHRGWVTDVFEQRSGRWVEVWSQVTPVPNNPDLLVQALKARP
jgi:hypothetical protein